MSKPDFRTGLNITELDKEVAKAAEKIHEAMKEANNNRLTSKAAAGRTAIILGAEFLDMLEEEIDETKKEQRELMGFKRKILRRVQQ